MEFKQSTLDEIIESEKEMFFKATDRYGDFFTNALGFISLLNGFNKSVDSDRYIFVMFLSQVRKHATLALFSSVRLHHVQMSLNLRQVLEASAWAAYAIVHDGKENFANLNEDGLLKVTKGLENKRNKWLDKNYPRGSNFIKIMKDSINESSAHSNIVYAHSNFRLEDARKGFSTPFFDIEDDYLIKTDLWKIGNIIMGILDLFSGVNKGVGVIKFIDDFSLRLNILEVQNHKLKAIQMATDRFKGSQ